MCLRFGPPLYPQGLETTFKLNGTDLDMFKEQTLRIEVFDKRTESVIGQIILCFTFLGLLSSVCGRALLW